MQPLTISADNVSKLKQSQMALSSVIFSLNYGNIIHSDIIEKLTHVQDDMSNNIKNFTETHFALFPMKTPYNWENENFTLSGENVSSLYQNQYDLYHIAKSLEVIVNPSIITQLNRLSQDIVSIIQPAIDADDEQEEKSMDFFGKVQEENNLFAIFSNFKILPEQLYSNHTFKNIKSISYEAIKLEINSTNRPKTWFDLWKLSDQLMRQSGDTHHCFLEDWHLVGNELQITTGS